MISVIKDIDKKLNSKTIECQKRFKEKLEKSFKNNNTRDAWQGMNTIIGRKQKQTTNIPHSEPDKTSYVNKLNDFYARFDCHDFSSEISNAKSECQSVLSDTCVPEVVVSESEVKRVFSRLNARKASGPDGVKGSVLKVCCEQLSNVLRHYLITQ